MYRWVLLWLWLMMGWFTHPVWGNGLERPQRIVSLSLCTDQVLLQLVEPNRIASLTHLAADKNYSYQWQAAKGLASHTGLAEDIVPLQPDVIIGMTFSASNTVNMMRRLGYPVITVDAPTTLDQVKDFVRHIAKAVGESQRGEQLLKTMQADIERARQRVANKPRLLAISYSPNGYNPGTNSLQHPIIEAAGYRNLAADLGIKNGGNLSVEQLISAAPDVIIIDEQTANQDSLAQSSVNHPVLRKLYRGANMQQLPNRYWLCPGPSAAKAILTLAEQR